MKSWGRAFRTEGSCRSRWGCLETFALLRGLPRPGAVLHGCSTPRICYTLQQRKQSLSTQVHLTLSSKCQPVYNPAFLSVYNTAMLGSSRYIQGGSRAVHPQRTCPPPLVCWSGTAAGNPVVQDLPELIASRLLCGLLTDYPRREGLCQEKHIKEPRE